MSWLAQNWFFILFGVLFVAMHLGHGGHRGHGGHGAPGAEPLTRPGDEDATRSTRGSSGTRTPRGHQH